MIELRNWQREAIEAALEKFEASYSHFLCLATPGAGKTVMASALANILIKTGKVDLVLCFSPSTVVANDFKVELEAITGRRFCGGLGASGSSLTYQSMRYLDTQFWTLLETFNVFVILDEIHHCAGDDTQNANAWGEQVLLNIQGKARYTMALTGTPWRSDAIPIALANYVNRDNRLLVDYRYDLIQAIKDGVCRSPHITLLDNELINVAENKNKRSFTSIADFLLKSGLSYFEIITHNEIIREVLKHGIIQLNKERQISPDAGGLIVAASVSHAGQIQLLLAELGESSEVVTYQEDDPESLIRQFKRSCQKWIISIGMISEGTNIPRLRVCCYLSLVTTELYFRQVLGRVLRNQYAPVETGYLIVPAHPRLLEYSKRIAEEVPHYAVIKSSGENESDDLFDYRVEMSRHTLSECTEREKDVQPPGCVQVEIKTSQGLLSSWYDSSIDSFGRFQQKVLSL
ncbi:DEAD/DEAH box helicase family protein [Alteromonadaceae bacterium A_SAG4]|nr:DEAD/DEAH box helicase family protein [Alteromonadaceae bacterium A_SAG4]NKX04319.1 DEAD/DEAH box helicase family protein [Alteromonadaceae bacterium A_SAG6]NKX19426.1 DEAD/DEAH box helicase family protein [Alteromonadaceae bacterium A_SAG8]NKX32974.1 DEAD/DEAH box helicase family protein [Alteromonadaceae bacterium A_SAG3]NKX68632.1 DEAD/DEAH box helicase family protein [Alteromonadaceae bacterium A_SAG7]